MLANTDEARAADDGRLMFLGIDFSGAAHPWKMRCGRPTVWVATLVNGGRPRLTDLRPVQSLPGEGTPFARLVALLRAGDFVAAGIDAPFAIPARHLPLGGHAELLSRVDKLPSAVDRPFPAGEALVALATEIHLLDQKKPYRDTERVWVGRGVNTRSTLWNGPRGGAAFAAACLTLLARAERPIWPWACGRGMLVEAFPAAQLRLWRLPCSGYGKPEQRGARERILAGLSGRLDVDAAQRDLMLSSPDALDAVIAAFAAIAATRQGALAGYPADGLIAVMHDGAGDSAPETNAPPAPAARNLLHPAGDAGGGEWLEEVLRRTGVRIERIVSCGHTTPIDEPYVQAGDEWVLVLAGSARLELAGLGERSLEAGEHLLIPARVPHRVTYTADPTIWLAIHFDDTAPG